MDISKFSDSQFNVKDWVNGALKLPKDSKISQEAHASTLVMKLQLFIQEINNSLEETGHSVVQSLPRVMRDVESVKQEALLLKEQMSIVKEDIKKVETDTFHSMQLLVELDSVKTRIHESQQALQEADNWVTLVVDVEDVFSTGDIEQISDKVIRMQQSLNVLHDVSDYEERKKLLETLKNRLETILSPKLLSSFNNHLTNDAIKYIQYFSGMKREQKVHEYYIQCHKNIVQEVWSAIQREGERNELTINLNSLYSQLLIKWEYEMNWTLQVFTSTTPLDTLVQIFNNSLNNLSPPLGQSIHTAVLKSNSPILTLIELKNIMLKFLKNFSKSLPEGIVKDSGHLLYSLVETIHTPFSQLLVQYGSLQQQELVKFLTNIKLLHYSGNIEESLQLISQSLSSVLTIINKCVEDCFLLTDGWGVVSAIKAIETFLIQFIKKLSSTLQELVTMSERNKDDTNDEWTNLQWIFQFIKYCGDLLLNLKTFNSFICSQVLSSLTTYKSPASSLSPFNSYDYLSIYHPEEHTAVRELLHNIEKIGEEYVLLTATTNQVKVLTSHAHSLAFNVVFGQLKRKLIEIPKLKVWERSCTSPLESPQALTDDLPSFSLSPLTYITEIGDHLLTLPEQLEPFTSQDNPSLMAAMKLGKLPYTPDDLESDSLLLSDAWLDAISRGTMETYVTSICAIPKLTDTAALQLATDIGYLCNVLAALDQTPLPSLTTLEKLLKSDKETFTNFKNDKQTDTHLYQCINKIRTWN